MDPSHDGLPSSWDLFSGKDIIDTLVKRHQSLVRIPSVCYDDMGDVDDDERWGAFNEIPEHIKNTYPNVDEHATLDTINKDGLVYTVQGSDKSLAPILLTAHQDVVPVGNETLDEWEFAPFDAHYNPRDGYLTGRGAASKADDFEPDCTIILAFGFDEQCSGSRGASAIAEFLELKFGKGGISVILNEGGAGLESVGDTLYVLPAVYEKGYLDVWFDLGMIGGSSGTPPPRTAIGIMSEITTALESNPFQPEVIRNSPVHEGLVCFTQYSPRALPSLTQMIRWGDLRGAAQLWAKVSPEKRFSIQTSQAANKICGGQSSNTLPESVGMGVNYRVAPQDSMGGIQHRMVQLTQGIARKYNIQLEAFKGDREYESYLAANGITPQSDKPRSSWEPIYSGKLKLEARKRSYATTSSPTSGSVWDTFSGTVRYTFGRQGSTVVPAPGAMADNTDTRHYLDLSRNIYRWTPGSLKSFGSIHTINEKLLMSEHVNMVKFYYDFIRNYDQANAWDKEMQKERKDL
ncbi:uncharacterized protein NECHADRAFT_94988 [Fusarium vanettenii 77-13-4]|uniref:Uncharacterized protein n=1 Tax=Fusarium vanettenii (strain ATCC MYA-4622 / CBS 123669 / FGSC 9596 / NRRL 45880 / 77-13-4) TaxID=660122 RepID=C7YXX9_FUSV7|nr:uncharacterized protein NECHADRAFT_94988 [Fusarium vanettenii 77-13-4]EEU43414.1 hypothetical protein NECHADRAFT_94988 [Fusarium vanettenii 77-13-4]